MATSIVVALPNCRDAWASPTNISDEPAIRQIMPSMALSPPLSDYKGHHHRSYSEIHRHADRPRLPSISNFLEGTGRPDLNFRPTFPGSTPEPSFQSRLHGARPPLSSPINQRPWSPTDVSRQHPQVEQSQAFRQQDSSDNYFPNDDHHRRSSVAVPNLSYSSDRGSTSYPITVSSRDGVTTQLRSTIKGGIYEDNTDGRGSYYVSDDVSVNQKTVNGDTVNPKWGTTKAGKPRKRLGQACNTCREKKIKCDPSYPKCTQCQKFGRECRFEAPTRPSQKSPKSRTNGGSPTASHTEDDLTIARRSSAAPTETSTHSEPGQNIVLKAPVSRNEHFSYHMASPRFDSDDLPTPGKRARLHRSSSDNDFASNKRLNEGPLIDGHHAALRSLFSRDVDPYAANQKLTEIYLKAYFSHINTTTYGLIPEKLFMQWVEGEQYKPPVTKLVMYCMLAVGCRFAKTPDKASHERIFTEIADEGVAQAVGQFSVHLIHARLIFSLHEFQVGHEQKAWDVSGAAMRAACAMKLNTEEGVHEICRSQQSVYGLEGDRLAECLRRTFWIAFIMDRFAVSCLGYATTFNKADLYLRLPCAEEAYETGRTPATHVFDGDEGIGPILDRNQILKLGPLACLAQIASIGCDVHILATRAKYQGSVRRGERYAAMRRKLEDQLRQWEQTYSSYLARHDLNTSPSSSSHSSHPRLGGLHILYHHACIVLHRHVHHTVLDSASISRHAKAAYEHACATLEIAQQLVSKSNQDIEDYNAAATSAFSGYAAMTAIDVLTAAGLNSDLLENDGRLMRLMMKGGVPLLDSLAEHWASAKLQRELVSDRTKSLFSSLQTGVIQGKVGFLFANPIVQAFGKDDDLVYGVDRITYFRAIGYGHYVNSFANLIEVRSKDRRDS